MAAAGLGAVPFFHVVFRINEWIYASAMLFILGSFFVKAAVAAAQERAAAAAQEAMRELTGGVDIPGLGGLTGQ